MAWRALAAQVMRIALLTMLGINIVCVGGSIVVVGDAINK